MTTTTTKRETRHYPIRCLSMYCGTWGSDCDDCPNKAAKDEFLAWAAEHEAVELDNVWSPNVYTATR